MTSFFKSAENVQEQVQDPGTAQPVDNNAVRTNRVITIGRSYGAGGRTIGKLLANELYIPYYDSELLTEVARASGFSRKYLEDIDEKPVQRSFSLPFCREGGE